MYTNTILMFVWTTLVAVGVYIIFIMLQKEAPGDIIFDHLDHTNEILFGSFPYIYGVSSSIPQKRMNLDKSVGSEQSNNSQE